jgi:hypothetical protein
MGVMGGLSTNPIPLHRQSTAMGTLRHPEKREIDKQKKKE